MKKRLIAKKNKQRHRLVLRQIKHSFKAHNIRFGNGYFIFTYGINSVCHFRLKGLPDWQFGMWHHDSGGVSFFGEHDLLIDKFKPSRTYLSEVINSEEDVEGLISLLTQMKDNSLLHFACSAQFAEFGVLGENALSPEEIYKEYTEDDDEEALAG